MAVGREKHMQKHMDKRKVTIIGAGHVGSHVALALVYEGVADEIVLVDKVEGKADAQALDASDAVSYMNHEVVVRGGDYSDVEDSQVVVCAIGQARKPGQNRVDMLDDSIVMCDELLESLSPYQFPGVLISITNPCDVIVDYLRRGLGLPAERAFGTGTSLDTARLRRVMSEMTGVSRTSVQGFVMGEHGESSMIPYSLIRVGGRGFDDFGLSRDDVLEQVRQGGWIVVTGKLCTEFGIGRAATELVEAVLRDEKKVLPASVLLDGQYGETGVQIGVPCVVGAGGIEQIVEVDMTTDELAARGNVQIALSKGTRGVE